jgi:hypothetical protein
MDHSTLAGADIERLGGKRKSHQNTIDMPNCRASNDSEFIERGLTRQPK